MTLIEKIVLGMMAVILFLIFFTVYKTLGEIEQAGGVKQVIIEVGKEIKDISHEIEQGDCKVNCK